MKFREELSRIFNKWSTNYFTDANTRLQKYSTNNQQIIGLRIWDPTAGCGRAGPASALAESCGPPGLRLTSKATSWKTWTWSEPEALTTDSELKSVRVRRRGPCCNVRVTGMRRRAVQPGLLALPHRGTVTGLSCQWHHHRVIRVRATDRDRRVRRPASSAAVWYWITVRVTHDHSITARRYPEVSVGDCDWRSAQLFYIACYVLCGNASLLSTSTRRRSSVPSICWGTAAAAAAASRRPTSAKKASIEKSSPPLAWLAVMRIRKKWLEIFNQN